MSQAEVAEKLNIGTKHYGHIEQGSKGCSIDLLLELSEILQVSTDYLLKGRSTNREAEIAQIRKVMAELDDLTCRMC